MERKKNYRGTLTDPYVICLAGITVGVAGVAYFNFGDVYVPCSFNGHVSVSCSFHGVVSVSCSFNGHVSVSCSFHGDVSCREVPTVTSQ